MKKTLIITVIVTLLFCIGILAIPKHNFPTDEEWNSYHEQLKNSPPSEKTLRGFNYCSPVQ